MLSASTSPMGGPMPDRIEKDSMGEVLIPEDRYYGASTGRAVQNFQISNRRFGRDFIEALGLLKKAAAEANRDLKLLAGSLAEAIIKAGGEVAAGKYDAHFPVDIFQTGSGTSTNMNANEVIANLANLQLGSPLGARSPVHPNDHVNRGQSSNDVIPSAIHVAAALQINRKLLPALQQLADGLREKAETFADIVKIGRTHLQDATPITLGQEFSGYAEQVAKGRERIQLALLGLYELAIGGTAVGTGINTHPQFATKLCEHLNSETKLQFLEAKNHFEAQAAKDAVVDTSGSLKTLAVSLMKIANDLRWLSSGPRCGIAEINLPALQPGSSIMPGKVNPVIPEAVMQVAAQVMGNDTAIMIGAQHGNFELNVMMPMMASNLLESIAILGGAATALADQCVSGIEPNRDKPGQYVEKSLALVTNLVPELGYDEAARLAKKAATEDKTIREILLAEGVLSKNKITELLDPQSMLKPAE